MNAEQIQVAGNHYKNMAYQPARFGFDVNLVSLGTSIAKYLVRDKGSRIENLEKAYHCLCLEQQFAKEDNVIEYFDIYNGEDWGGDGFRGDEHYLDKFFDQFPDGDKLKAVMRKYMQANFPQAKGLLRKYINELSKPRPLQAGDTVIRISNTNFSHGLRAATISRIDIDGKVWFKETGTWLYAKEVKRVSIT